MSHKLPFWKKPLSELSLTEWESLCDGCGRCCLHKLEDEETGGVAYTSVACRYLNIDTCRCTQYSQRTKVMPGCIKIRPEILPDLTWMPATCAYRLLAEGKDLLPWHPLLSGNANSVHTNGASIRAFAIAEAALDDPDDLFAYVIS